MTVPGKLSVVHIGGGIVSLGCNDVVFRGVRGSDRKSIAPLQLRSTLLACNQTM